MNSYVFIFRLNILSLRYNSVKLINYIVKRMKAKSGNVYLTQIPTGYNYICSMFKDVYYY